MLLDTFGCFSRSDIPFKMQIFTLIHNPTAKNILFELLSQKPADRWR